MVTIDRDSAERLASEGAIWLDADSERASCDGHPVALPGAGDCDRPILVTGSDPERVVQLVRRLCEAGLPAWQVSE